MKMSKRTLSSVLAPAIVVGGLALGHAFGAELAGITLKMQRGAAPAAGGISAGSAVKMQSTLGGGPRATAAGAATKVSAGYRRIRHYPAAVSDLSAAPGINPGSAALTWTAPGADGRRGRAASYRLVYATMPIAGEAAFAAAMPYPQTPAPLAPGATQTLALSGLPPGATVYFSLRAVEPGGNRGPLSGAAQAFILAPTAVGGTISYSGTQAGPVLVSVLDSSAVLTAQPLTSTRAAPGGAYYLDEVRPDWDIYLFAFVDTNQSLAYEAGEDYGFYGGSTPAAIRQPQGSSASGINFSVAAASAPGLGSIAGALAYAGAQAGALRLEAFNTPAFSGQPVAALSLAGPGPYTFPLPGDRSYYLRAYVDADADGAYDADEAHGIYAPPGQGPQEIYAPRQGVAAGAAFTIYDPGCSALGCAGLGAAAVSISSAAAGEQAGFDLTVTVGAGGLQAGGLVSFGVPPGWGTLQNTAPAGPGHVALAVDTLNIAAAQLDGDPATAAIEPLSGRHFAAARLLSGSLDPGDTLKFTVSRLAAPCQTGPGVFTVATAQGSSVPVRALAAGSPSVEVRPGAAVALAFIPPSLTLTQYATAQLLLAGRDLCGRVAPLEASTRPALSGAAYSFATGAYEPSADLKISTSAGEGFAAAHELDFAAGQSTAALYALASATGTLYIQAAYRLDGTVRYAYCAVAALQGDPFSGVNLSSGAFATSASAITITPDGDGSADFAFINFSLADQALAWRVEIASVPFSAGGAALWQAAGSGSAAPGRLAWDGRFNAGPEAGRQAPSGVYHVRITAGGVSRTQALITVLVNRLDGQVTDPAFSPPLPVADARVQAHGPAARQAVTDSAGRYSIFGLPVGTYTVTFAREQYISASTRAVVASTATQVNMPLSRAPTLEIIPALQAGATRAWEQWGTLTVHNPGWTRTFTLPLRLPAGTTTFDDGGQWDAALQRFVYRTRFRFEVAQDTYTALAQLSGYFPSSATAHVGPAGLSLALPAVMRRLSLSGGLSLSTAGNPVPNPSGLTVSVVALSGGLARGSALSVLPPGVNTGTYTIHGLAPGAYTLRASAPGFEPVSAGPAALAGADMEGLNLPPFTAGGVIRGELAVSGDTSGFGPLAGSTSPIVVGVTAWSPASSAQGRTSVLVSTAPSAASAQYRITGLPPGGTYFLFADIAYNADASFYSPGGFPKLVFLSTQSQAVHDFSFGLASGAIAGQLRLPDPASELGAPPVDFTRASARWRIVRSDDPLRVGRGYEVASSTSLPGFRCGGLTPPSGSAPGCAPGISSASFTLGGLRTETLELTFVYAPTGLARSLTVAVVNGATAAAAVDARGDTHAVGGRIVNRISNPLFNTNALLAQNAPLLAPPGYPAELSSTTARVEAVRRDFGELLTRVSTAAFDAAKTRVGLLDAAGNYSVTGLQDGVYLLRTLPLRAHATGPVLVPSAERVVTVAGASRSGVDFTLADGFAVSGRVALADGLADARELRLTLRNRRGEIVDAADIALGNPGAGLPASSAPFLFERVPAAGFYTLEAEDLGSPARYVARPVSFPDRAASPDGLQAPAEGLELSLRRAAFLTGRLRDANSGALLAGDSAALLPPNFRVYAVANPWVEGGYAEAAAGPAGRPVGADGVFRIGPLAPGAVYDAHFRQDAWDMAYLKAGSQNYAPAVSAQHALGAGEVRDLGIVSLNQGQSIRGVVSGPSGERLPNIAMSAAPALVDEAAAVRTQTAGDGSYTLWVSSHIARYFDLTAAPREENLSSAGGGLLYGPQTVRVDLHRSSSAHFSLRPLPGALTGQVLTSDGGPLSYPYGAQKGFPAAAVFLQRAGLVPLVNPLGDISAMTGPGGAFEVPALSTGVYSVNIVSLGYIVHSSTVAVAGGPVSAGTLTLQRGASVFGALRKTDPGAPSGYSCPNEREVAGIAAADEDFREYLTGTVETGEASRAVCAYEITGFKPGLTYHLALLGAGGGETVFPAGGTVSFEAQESTSARLLNLTWRPPVPECLPSFRYLGNDQVQLQFRCNKALRNETGLDNDLDYILSLTTYTSSGAPLAAPNGTGEFLGADKRLLGGRRNLTAVYRPAAGEARFSVRLRAYTAEADPATGASHLLDQVYDVYTAVDASRSRKIDNVHGGRLELEATGEEDLVENTSVDLPPGAFVLQGSTYAQPGTSVQLGIKKGRTREQVQAQALSPGAVTPSDAARLRTLEAYPEKMAAAIAALREGRVQGYAPAAAGAGPRISPFSAFYDIFLPLGIRRELREKARLTLSYDAALSSATPATGLNIWYHNPATGRFELEAEAREVDTVNRTVSALVDHFSTFVVLASTPVYTSTTPFSGAAIEVFNFPNPFNLETKTRSLNLNAGGGSFTSGAVQVTTRGTIIRVGVPRALAGHGKLRIYTLAGELVREYDCGWLDGAAGVSGSGTYYYFEWDGRNSSGRDVASDVYFGEIKIGGSGKFWKMAVVKDSRYR